jgi:basic membrane protein A
MKKQILTLVMATLLILAILVSCKKNDSNEPIKVGLVSGVGGFDDRGFNQLALTGLTRAGNDLNVVVDSRASADTAAIRQNIDYFVQPNFNLIITLGYGATAPILDAAQKNPSIKFAVIDDSLKNTPSNMSCYVFRVDQPAFLCGFLAASWVNLKDPQDPIVGWVGGPQVPTIEQFRIAYLSGVQYFNNTYLKDIQTMGTYSSSFSDTLQGAMLADSLINLGADLIFPFAGKTGNGVLYKTKEKGKWSIGVDIDQYSSIPEVSGILITSCLKKLDNTVYDLIKKTASGEWEGNTINYGSLSGGNVEIAPFHDYDALIPDSIKNALNVIRAGINNETIPTGWNP